MQSKILITGITGLLGTKLALKFKGAGYNVVGLKQKGTPLTKDLINIDVFEGDINDSIFLDNNFFGVDVVIHTAALVSFDRRDKVKLFEINTEGTKNVVNSCLKQSVGKLIYISSIAALGRTNVAKVIDENQLWEESDYNTNYGYSKFLGEVEFWRGIEEGLDGFCVNPSVILGCGDIDKSSNKIFKNRFKKYVPYTDGSINVIDERDVVQIIYDLFNSEHSYRKYILNGHKVTIKDLLSLITKDTGANLVKIGKGLVKVGWVLDGFFKFLIGKRPQLTKETLKVLNAESDYNNTRVVKELDYRFRTINETIEYCNSFYEHTYK